LLIIMYLTRCALHSFGMSNWGDKNTCVLPLVVVKLIVAD
jgi:hypothetical protein